MWQKRPKLVQKQDGTQFAREPPLAIDISDAKLIFKRICHFGSPAGIPG
jgi:hypothetical protein